MSTAIEPIGPSFFPERNGGSRKRVLVCVPRYLPGYKSGGPTRAIANMVTNLKSRVDFYVVTRDRDATDTVTFPGVTPDRWHSVAGAQVLYCSSINPAILRRAYREVQPDVISLNSFHDTFTRIMIQLRRRGVFGNTPIVLAPRGEFSPGAQQIKRAKKLLYGQATKLLGLHEDLLWQASSSIEKQHILQTAPVRRLDPDSVHVAMEMTDAVPSTAPHLAKTAGAVKLAFIARISEMKNHHFLLDVLREVRGDVHLELYGPIAAKDEDYWNKCRKLLERLPAGIKFEYQGSVDHSIVPKLLHDHHFFVLPTRGENFCHAVVESFINGTPVVISDETPWTQLAEAGAGFDLPLADRQGWISAIQKCVDMDQREYDDYLRGATEYSRRFSPEVAAEEHAAMFEAALASRV